MSGLVRGAAVALIVVALSPCALADQSAAAPGASSQPAPGTAASKPDVATLLFGTPQWSKAPPGTKIRYTFEKTTADPAFGPGFKDEVVITLDKGEDADSRTAEMQLFSGANRKPAGPFRSDKQNPVLLVVLENNVQEMSKLFKANPRYLKNAIRKAWRDKATIEPVTDDVNGTSVKATRIAITPFVGDAEAGQMMGLADMSYVVDVSDEVPGAIVAIDIRANDAGKTRFAETLRYASEVKP